MSLLASFPMYVPRSLKYFVGEMEGVYGGLELGWLSMRTSASGEVMGQSFDDSDSTSRFGLTLGGGWIPIPRVLRKVAHHVVAAQHSAHPGVEGDQHAAPG